MGIEVKNFGDSFADGWTLGSLLHAFDPDAIDLTLLGDNKKTNLAYVLDIASIKFLMPAILGPEDISLLATTPRSMTRIVQLCVLNHDDFYATYKCSFCLTGAFSILFDAAGTLQF